ncbi:hypothetical protein LTR20_009347 [Exophiala xenobiotica]|nr:hypothetical protein LTR40_008631 [Exophiala xenobiotica]KAK5361767.1 hypothetical protein LTS13_009768 [Exophiala xenobiotica]KAK5393185.1 hypothetical protein LTR79_009499 [Exophiala xenobiotica]KAK5456406.1 hypothetical protein LTR20_009347 [Exophiala xenobiotica]KAK5472308.1 hypothetical protein LTR26_010434 [Exophiala xenobiotica]
MTSHSAWIERDSQGRPYFVRSRPKRLSIRQLLVQKLLSRKDRSLFSFRDSRQNHHIQYHPGGKPPEIPAPASNSPHSPQPYDRPPTPGPPQMAPTSQGQPQPVNMYLVPPQQQNPEPPSSHVHNINAAYQHNPPSQPPFMPYVPSPMHLLPPHVPPAFPGPPFQQQMPFSMPPAPFPPPHPLQVPGQRLATNFNPSDLRYKCEVCGRFRSTRYHYRHPILPGQIPTKTVCRKCRERATDSEDDSSCDSAQSSRRRHRSHGRGSRNRSRHRQKRHNSRRRSRSDERSRVIDNRRRRHGYTSDTDSASSTSSDGHYRDRDRRSQRSESSHRDLARHTRRLRLSPVEQLIIYDDDRPGRRVRDAEFYRDDEEYENRRGVRGLSRPPPQSVRQHRREHARTDFPAAQPTTYADEEHHHVRHAPYQTNPRPYSPQQGPTNHAHFQAHRRPGYDGEFDDDDGDHGQSYGRMRSPSNSRQYNMEEGGTHHSTVVIPHPDERGRRHRKTSPEQHDHGWVHAPSPPPIRSSSLGYLPGSDAGGGLRHDVSSGKARRRRSRSRRPAREKDESSMISPGDALTLIERHARRPTPEEYEGYASDGMRVQVREF